MTSMDRESLLRAVEDVLDNASAEVTRLVGEAIPEPASDEELRAQIVAAWNDVEDRAGEIGANWRWYLDAVMTKVWPLVAGLQRQIRLLKALPGRVDGDVLAQILWANAPDRWTDEARTQFADDMLGAMAASGFYVHRVAGGTE